MGNIKKEKMVVDNYTKEQKEFYQNMMEEIGSHEDFGKRNPVDIGIDCGYSEDDIMKMIQMCQNRVQDDGEAEIYYFMLRRQEERYIVSVNINNWKVEIVKKLDKPKGYTDFYFFEIAYDTAVWVSFSNDKQIFWENLKTGKSGKFLLDFGVYEQDILVIEDGVIVRTGKLSSKMKFIKYGFDKPITEVEYGGAFGYLSGYLLDGGNIVYCVNVSSSCGRIYSISKDLKSDFKKECEYMSSSERVDDRLMKDTLTCCEIGIDNGKPFTYSFYEKWSNKSIFNLSSIRVAEKFTLSGFERKYGHYVHKTDEMYHLIKDFTTEHYQLLGNSIYLKENGDELNEVCRFDRMLNSNQGVSIFSKDIFIGVTYIAESDETAIIKIDMQKEREAVILPLEIPAKGKGR